MACRKDNMKTVTIADARKNLSRLLQAAAKGEDIGIVSGADIIALRKVGVYSDDYAWTEYRVTREQVDAYEKEATKRHDRQRRASRLIK